MKQVKAVLLVGGPSKGTRFRPLSLETPKPLVPICGKPLIWHHMNAIVKSLSTLENYQLSQIVIIGFYNQTQEWNQFIQNSQTEFNVPIRYLKEQGRLGTAGGINQFRTEILESNPDYFFVLHCDVVCSFPLAEILKSHQQSGKEITILGKRVSKEEANRYGVMAVDPTSHVVLHYAEKPETIVSDIINCGVYLFSATSFFNLIDQSSRDLIREPEQDPGFLQLEQDLFMKISHKHQINCFETQDFWIQLKSAGSVIKCTEYLLKILPSQQLAKNEEGRGQIVGNVIIHSTAKVDPSAKIGPNVSIGEGVTIGSGVRISNSIILDGAEIKERACILYSVVGWKSVIGRWARLEGVPDFSLAGEEKSNGITILGAGVSVSNESIVRSSIALPHKELSGSYANQILL
eukprot:TRINITY_DN2602_c0_g1_i1.p1 TRINITY_DN2602_c0_g1~~TRINITY_DN2602_c0_g1_i1.p1  ORF type:complete len:405 (+),score=96.65 TRINITY_DN2602_c0_g1_i1:93-1307(+)